MQFGNGITGYMSNSRIVKGTAVYDPTVSTYTVPTAPLINISGTSVLTFQNSTNIDNSSNAFTLTPTGTVVDSVAYPFNLNLIKDYSANANNWTANNIQPVGGSGMDVMTDVPTLTSATAANYAVLNPLAIGASGTNTLSQGNLYFTDPINHSSVTSTMGAISGKTYYEANGTLLTGQAGGLGITTSTVPYASYPSNHAGLWWVYDNGGSFIIKGPASDIFSSSSKAATGQVWQLAFDMSTGYAWFGINNSWYDSSGGTTGNPSAGTNPTFTGVTTTSPMFAFIESAGFQWNLNFGQQPFKYTPPSGFVALNTYNI
jgi:hypothetical protein